MNLELPKGFTPPKRPNTSKEYMARLALEFQKRYTNLVVAHEPDDVQNAAVELGALFNEHIEQVVYALRKAGGLSVVLKKP